MAINTELLIRIKDRLLAEPENFEMQSWHCGSTHCIGGWAQVIAGTPVSADVPSDSSALGLTGYKECPGELLNLDEDQASRLFLLYAWPSQFCDPILDECRNDVMNPDWRKHLARISADRIDHFIATEGRE